ncbi:hypothetical protein [Ornithinimicrobium tianjinense]|uniref:Uncharacterized protein n=1 Tax=Ornithinimicrobium tianjinense TaxID=1195761 RepID=A0A917BKN2_9MICO|nr:hypothetical protein [Ornithinimicrobium tianjinense]GGF44244.1 hypothetical protein GCM10011366_09920 [Ornithinimicrobium tianjinense]
MSTPSAQHPAPAPASAPLPAAQPSPATAQRSSTPSRLRLARGLATAAALLTGVVATGTFDTDGVNATPNVVAAQWEAAERAGTQVAAADLEVARTVAEAVAGLEADEAPTTFPDLVLAAADDHSHTGVTTSAGLTDLAITGDRAIRSAAADPDAATQQYVELQDLTNRALTVTDTVAADRADALMTGSRSVLTSVVGGVSTLLLLGLLVWLALVTRRILNVPLLVATAITGGLTYVSLNPAALPVQYDQRIESTVAAADALQEVRQTRSAQYAQVMGLGAADEAVDATAETVEDLDMPAVEAQWAQVAAGQAELSSADGAEAQLAAIEQTQEQFARVEQSLSEHVTTVDVALGRSASITSGLALVLGIVAAAAAWTGLTRRLRDYR